MESDMRIFLVIMAMLFTCSSAHAMGVGDITVKSRLGEPLHAEIDVFATDKELASSPSITLAPREIHTQAGIHITRTVSTLAFKLAKNEKDMPVILVSTKDLVREPTVTFMVEVEWPGGRILRQYSVHLQPK
jgi:pilus assembly protein FimV